MHALKPATRALEFFTAIDSTGEYKSTPVMTRSLSAKRLALKTFQIQPARVEITLGMGGNRDTKITISERTSVDDLRKIVSMHLGGRRRVQPHRFPLQDGTEMSVIPSFLALTSLDSTMNVVVPYMVHYEHKRPIEIAPETPDDMLELIAARYMGEPTKVHVPRRHIRTSHEFTMITRTYMIRPQKIQLLVLREADKFIPKAPIPTTTPPTTQQLFRQTPPPAQSRDITPPWEVSKPSMRDFAKQGDRIPVILQIEEPISEPSRKKVYLHENRDESWETDRERAFDYRIEIRLDVMVASANDIVPCLVRYPPDREVPSATKGVIHVTFRDHV
jgi:hypothetical protein